MISSRYITQLYSLTGLLAAMLMAWQAEAQTPTDALRFSTSEIFGTARSMSVGGAMGALGADFGMIDVNPAGTGAYRSSEFVFSGVVLSQTTSAELINGGIPASEDNETRFAVSNIGIVFATQPRNKSWKASNFAVGYSKTADYGLAFNYSGRTPGSITDRWKQNADGLEPNQLDGFESGLAYDTDAIYDLDDPPNFIYETDYQMAPRDSMGELPDLLRRQSVDRSGTNGEVILSYGANYNEKLLFGITLGIPIVRFEEEKSYEEEDELTDEIPYFNALRFEESLQISGNGFNVKLGANYKIGKYFTIGAAYHSRTRYSLSDDFGTNLTYDYTIDNNRIVNSAAAQTPEEGFQYNLSTPSSFIGNFSYIISSRGVEEGKKKSSRSRGKKKKKKGRSTGDSVPRKYHGFVAAQIHYKNYGNAKLDFTSGDNDDVFKPQEDRVNEEISNSFSSAIEMRFGAEYMLKKLRLRAGLVMTQSPFVEDSSFNNTYSAGVGYRFNRVFLDFGYQYRQSELFYSPYNVSFEPRSFVTNNANYNRFMLTFGYKWL